MAAKAIPISEDMFAHASVKEIRFTIQLNESALAKGFCESGYFKGRADEMRERIRIAKDELQRRSLPERAGK